MLVNFIRSNTILPEIKVFQTLRHQDSRGFFSEIFNKKVLSELGVNSEYVQDNQSLSTTVNTIRGLHFQAPPFEQAKLVRCVQGKIFDVAVDIRKESPTFGKWVGYEVSAKNGYQIYIPAGFAHGFLTLEEDTEINYKCTNYYSKVSEGSIVWNDPNIGIKWPVDSKTIILSEKDNGAPFLKDIDTPFRWDKPA